MPKIYTINGKDVELYTIGELADRLDRQRQTLRKWERDGIIPQALFRSKTNRRLYTKAQCDAIVSVVEKYDLKQGQAIPPEFREEVFKAFKEASKEFEEFIVQED